MRYYLAIDLGASNGRHIIGWLEHEKIRLKEIYRFENEIYKKGDYLSWDGEAIFREIINGIKKCKEAGLQPTTMAIDTWGVDYALLDRKDCLIPELISYRDHRTDRSEELLNQLVSERKRYERTGILSQKINTVNQLSTDQRRLNGAKSMLMTPDYYNFLLTGICQQEYTIATTSGLINAVSRDWDKELITKLNLPEHLFLPVSKPSTSVGAVKEEVREQIGFPLTVLHTASHDTACAVMAVPNTGKDFLFISSGTWSLMGIESISPGTSVEYQKAGFTNEGGYGSTYTIVKNIMGLWMIQSVRKEMAPNLSYPQIVKEAERTQIDSYVECRDDCFLSPDSMTGEIQRFCKETGQKIPVTIGEFARVIYQSLARCYSETKTEIEKITKKHYSQIHIIGGGCQVELLNQLTSQMSGCSVIAGPIEAAACGNVISQMLYDGTFSDIKEARECVKRSF